MADTKVLVSETNLKSIANAIRAKNGTEKTYKPITMADAINELKTESDIYIQTDKAWAIELVQTDNQIVDASPECRIEETTDNRYYPTFYANATVTPYTNYMPGAIVKTPNKETATIVVSAKPAEPIEGKVEDGWALVYAGTDGYYSDPEYTTKITSSSLSGNILIAGRKSNTQNYAISTNSESGNSLITKWKDNFITDLTLDGGSYDTNKFYNYKNLTELILPNLKSTGTNNSNSHRLCSYCEKLVSVDVPNIEKLGNSAFNSCSSLTSIELPVCTSVGNYAFYSCSKLTSIELPVCTSVGNYAFNSCSSLTSIELPVCTSVGNYAFNSCSSLTSIELPVCTSVGNYAFESCSSLTSIELPVCTSVGNSAFYYCSKLTSIELPVCTSVGDYAFESCSKLTSIELPVCTSVGYYAFYSCSSLTTIILRSETLCKATGSQSFYNSNIKIYVPEALLEKYKAADYWSSWASRFASLEEYDASQTSTAGLDKDDTATLELDDKQISVDELIVAAENDLNTAQKLNDEEEMERIKEYLKELYTKRDGTSVDDTEANKPATE